MDRNSSRINKYRKYREQIDSNENIHLSIINSDKELKELFESINFNVEQAYKLSGSLNSNYDFKNIKKINETKELNEILEDISSNSDSSSNKSIEPSQFNSHKNDALMKEYFVEFINKEELQFEENQETTDLKIKKINIIDNVE